MTHYEQSNGNKFRKSRHQTLSIENATPNLSQSASTVDVDANKTFPSKKRSSAQIAAAAILSSTSTRRRRIQRKTSNDKHLTSINNIKQEIIDDDNSSSIDTIDDELLRRLSQSKMKIKSDQYNSIEFLSILDFVYVDQQQGIRWIGTKARLQPINSLLSRCSWKPRMNHYEKYSDIIRTSEMIDRYSFIFSIIHFNVHH